MRSLILVLLPNLLLAAEPDPLLPLIRQRISDWRRELPDFLCTQESTFDQGNRGRGIRMSDSAFYEIRVVRGRESYVLRSVAGIDIKANQLEPVDLAGMNHRGEFSSALLLLFDAPTKTLFHRADRERVDGRRLRRYDFKVRQENSQWYVGPGAAYQPAYEGSFWADEADGKVYRLHMEAHQFPRKYVVQDAWLTVTYSTVSIEGEPFLMPAQAEVRACHTLMDCSHVYMKFTDYRHFTATSKVDFKD
ncbi:hypothetical protein [Paludibaculum fermentans]|uniref:Outer membrane lipoprotein-sorting protein n=1 Tax=Paludibaculum fermentans TaxID=1473598 RepID=A0A7S7SI66_PALFE|nr:hypothetical protein [Paludibaculum fermentans]QOY85388.1 hypothetical protein IRI77_21445 [Paludibaculum fermentans]